MTKFIRIYLRNVPMIGTKTLINMRTFLFKITDETLKDDKTSFVRAFNIDDAERRYRNSTKNQTPFLEIVQICTFQQIIF